MCFGREQGKYQGNALNRQQAQKHNRIPNIEGREVKMSCVQLVAFSKRQSMGINSSVQSRVVSSGKLVVWEMSYEQ